MVENMLPHIFVILMAAEHIVVRKFGAENAIIWLRAKIPGQLKRKMDMELVCLRWALSRPQNKVSTFGIFYHFIIPTQH